MRVSLILRFVVCGILATNAVGARQLQAPTDPSVVLTSQRNQTAQLAATWLHSGDPRMQAWAAYVVLRDQHVDLIPEMTAMVNEYEVTPWPVAETRRDQHDAMIAMLDTLIQLHRGITASGAARLYPEFPAQSLILLSWEGEGANDSLLNIFRNEKAQRFPWLAAGNMLLERHVPGFAAAALSGLTLHADVWVVTTDVPRTGHGSGGSCLGGSEGKANWPIVGNYALVQKGNGATLLADGEDSVYYRRTVSGEYDHFRDSCCGDCGDQTLLLDLYREHYLAKLLSARLSSPPIRTSFDESIVWKNEAAYSARLREIARREQQALATVATNLRAANLLSAEEAAAVKMRLEITIVDERKDKTVPLPRVEKLGENVTLKM
jgi:hypothetical protein